MEERETVLEDLRDEFEGIKWQLERILKDLKIADYEETIRGEIESIDYILIDINLEITELERKLEYQDFIVRQEELRHMENEWR